MSRSRAWCFTINNYTADDVQQVLELDSVYLIFGFEKGENGTPHIQGFVRFKEAKTITSVKKKIVRSHLEIPRKPDIVQQQYCSKEGDYYEFGDYNKNGDNETRKKINEMLKNNCSKQEIIDVYPSWYLMHKQKIDSYYDGKKEVPKERNLILIDNDLYERRYEILPEMYKNACYNLEYYQGEEVYIIDTSYDYKVKELERWLVGIPWYYKYGYETRKYHFHTVVIVAVDNKEYNYVNKHLGQHITDIIKS